MDEALLTSNASATAATQLIAAADSLGLPFIATRRQSEWADANGTLTPTAGDFTVRSMLVHNHRI